MIQSKIKKWDLLQTKEVFEAKPWIKVFQDKIRLTNGRIVNDFYRVDLPEFVMIYAYDEQGNVLIEKKYEHAINEICFALPAGCMEAGEESTQTAKRELLEETGYIAHSWKYVSSFYMDSNRGCGKAHFFIATQLEKVSEPKYDDMEEVEVSFEKPEFLIKHFLSVNSSLANIALMAIASNAKFMDVVEKK